MQSHARRGMRSRTILLPVEKTFQPVLWLHCPNELFDLIGARVGAAAADGAHTHMGQRASEAGSEEKDDWQGQDAERQLSGWHWQTAREEIAKKFCGRNYALNFTALQGCNMSTWRWTWGRNLSVNEGWQDSPPESFSSDLSSTKNLAPWSMQNLPAWFRKEAMGPPRPAYNFSAWNRSVEEGNGVQEYYLRSKTCHKGTPKECLPPPLVHFSSLCIFTSLSEPLSV